MTYYWDFGETSSPNNNSTAWRGEHWYSGTALYNVNLRVTSIADPILNGGIQGCVHDTTILLNTIHPQPMANFEQSQPTACLGDVVSFKDRSASLDGVTTQWFWDMGDGTTFNI